jgi:hypothetical protein
MQVIASRLRPARRARVRDNIVAAQRGTEGTPRCNYGRFCARRPEKQGCNTGLMTRFAKMMTDDEIKVAAQL